jgi:hypothetical protein
MPRILSLRLGGPRTHGGPLAVDDERLRVQRHRLLFVHAHARTEQCVVPGASRRPDDIDIGAGPIAKPFIVDAKPSCPPDAAIFVMRPDGTDVRRLTDDATEEGTTAFAWK